MRSRYTAHVRGDADHLFRTWHPRTRPDDVRPDPTTRWTGLRVLAAEGDTVEFVASWEGGAMHEVSRFEQRAGRWVYVDGRSGDLGQGRSRAVSRAASSTDASISSRRIETLSTLSPKGTSSRPQKSASSPAVAAA